MTMINAVVCDMDGLLIDTESIGLETFLSTSDHFGVSLEPDMYIGSLGLNSEKGKAYFSQELREHIDPDEFITYWSEHFDRVQRTRPVTVMRGAQKMLSLLHKHNIPLAVATSSAGTHARDQLFRAGLLDFFEHIVSGDQVDEGKPSPHIFLEAARRLDVDPKRCVALEDSVNGVNAAYAAGMYVFHVPDLAMQRVDLPGDKVSVVESLDDVVDFLEQQL